MTGGSWPKSPNSRQECPPKASCERCGNICRRRLSTCPRVFLPTMDISSMMRYLIADSDCWSWCRRSPSRSLKSPLVGRPKREWRVWPSTLKAATPVGAATRSRASRSSRRQLMRYDFPVPAVPDTIMCSGGGSAASAC